ncbi:epidermal patterning factor-like protein [Artemisia annua]|uniref:Epidermal patterning factor-like protein n=1 Tax=Artemisia annua TaxID=35608 RepID=A0A2U1PBB6_ARTAN|nr:epidermal patterning factor-like protein [Artemisia annua]
MMIEGGWTSKLIDNDTQVIKNTDEHDAKMGMSDLKAGSRPPTCARKKYCRKCGKCEAIQVPILGPRTRTKSRSTITRRDDISNYKPLCWKCKCGDFIFSP